jgi:molybdenum ABC transporter molybdate-binding protein
MTHRHPRRAALSGIWLAFLGSVVLFAVLVGLLFWPSGDSPAAQGPIVIYCAAGIKPAVEAVARDYEQHYGVEVRPDYGGSQSLLSRLIEDGRDSGHADLYLPADDSYIQMGRDRGLLAETLPLAHMHPILAVAAGNPKKIASLDDLLRPGLRLAQANPDVAAIGKVTRDALRKSGHWDEIQRHTTVSKTTVNDVANAVQLGTVDAGFVWDATVRQVPGLEAIHLPQLNGYESSVSVAVLAGSRQPTAALRFARYLAARDRGLIEFEKHGLAVADGDDWAERPQLVLYAGAMLQRAVEPTLKEFERREGVEIVTKYLGCGILVADMKSGQRPDAYFACDKSFMDMVGDLFVDNVDISTNRLVILVHKGNPHGIKSLDDLGKPGLRIGVGHEKQCALGVLTQKALEQGRVRPEVMGNVKVQSPAGDMLVNQMLAGALDAVIAYVSNRAGHEDELEAVPIDVPCAVAVQPVAVGRESKHRQLTQRLLAAIRSAESKERFEANGFHWRTAGSPSPPAPLPKGARGDGER